MRDSTYVLNGLLYHESDLRIEEHYTDTAGFTDHVFALMHLEARNALARAVFFNHLGEIRDRSFEQQRYRASGLSLLTAAIVLWNTVYLERAANALRGHGQAIDDALLQYLSPLGWEHINLIGDYVWRSRAKVGAGKFRPLRPLQPA